MRVFELLELLKLLKRLLPFESFTYPYVLLLLAIPLVLLSWVWRREDRRLVLPFDHGRPDTGRAWWVVLTVAESVPALILAVVIFLIAGPQRLGEPREKR